MIFISLDSGDSADTLVLRSMDTVAAAASENVLIHLQVVCLTSLLARNNAYNRACLWFEGVVDSHHLHVDDNQGKFDQRTEEGSSSLYWHYYSQIPHQLSSNHSQLSSTLILISLLLLPTRASCI